MGGELCGGGNTGGKVFTDITLYGEQSRSYIVGTQRER